MAEKTLKDLGNGFIEVVTSVKDGEKTVPLKYQVPKGYKELFAWAVSLPATNEAAGKTDGKQNPSQEWIYHRYCYAADLKERANVRESVAAESTTVMVGGKPFDLLSLSDLKAVQAVNANFLWSATTGKETAKAAIVARRKLIEAGRAVEGDGGMLKVAKK